MDWVPLILLYSIAFGTVTSISAKSKNRDQITWFIVGFFLGVFGLIASLLVEKAPKEDIESSEPSRKKKCPDCAEEIILQARVCRYCGRKFDESEIASVTSTSVNDPRVLQDLIDKLSRDKPNV